MLVFAAVSVIAPFANATRFSARIQSALEEFLGRPVSFEKASYRVLPVPGFSLEKVTIGDDARFGLEPFGYMEGLEARLRVDKLLLGEIRFASIRLIDPSLNVVKRDDGAWNVVELVKRLSAPRRAPLNLVPAIQISNGRFDFKLGVRKTTFYVTNADLSLYPDLFGKVVCNFMASPARTDRAGNGFGSMRGSVSWYPDAVGDAKQLEADVNLEPSNLSELTTLVEGHDIGVHGTILSHAHMVGPMTNLKVTGDLELKDVHRWDLLPASGDDWRVPYEGDVDLAAQRLTLRTLQRAGELQQAAVEVGVENFSTKPAWHLRTELNHAPLEAILPLARRMGLVLPAGLELVGAMDGAVQLSNTAGSSGEILLHDAVAKSPGLNPISAPLAKIKVLTNGIHLEPVAVQSEGGGELKVGGDYSMPAQNFNADITMDAVPVMALKKTAEMWFGAPPALAAVDSGVMTGELHYYNTAEAAQNGWAGQLQLSNAALNVTGLQGPLKHTQADVVFTPATLDLPHFSGQLGQQAVQGSYRYALKAKHAEKLHVEMASANAADLAAILEPAWNDKGILSSLPFTKRQVPPWLANRNLEGELTIGKLAISGMAPAAVNARFLWQGTVLQITSLGLRLPDSTIAGSGVLNLAARRPHARIAFKMANFRWAGGMVALQGQVEGTGIEGDLLETLRADGTFSGEDLALSASESFDRMSGEFQVSFADKWPRVVLSKVSGKKGEEEWSGTAASNRDGQLIFDLGSGEKQLHIVSALGPITPVAGKAALTSEAR